MTTLANFVLDVLETTGDGGAFDTNNYSPHPILFNKDDSERRDTGERTKSVDLTEGNVITVGSDPTTERTPVGTGFGYRTRAGVTVLIEGTHVDNRGDITDSNDFGDLVDEVTRALSTEQTYPRPAEDEHTLIVSDIDDLSPNNWQYYGATFDVFALGYDDC